MDERAQFKQIHLHEIPIFSIFDIPDSWSSLSPSM